MAPTSTPAPPIAFEGFSPAAIQFLVDLAANNERSWFQPRKAEFERLLKGPLEALCVALGETFARRGIPLSADPARSPFRIYRDVRFSKDKSPYKTHVSASFAWAGGGDGDAGGYFHLQPGEIYVGGGKWHPEPAWLAAWRTAVATDPARVHGAIDEPRFLAMLGPVDGDRLKRIPSGYPADHPDAALLTLKDVTFGRRLSDADAMSPNLPETIAETFEVATPVMRLLAELPVA
jgi:uncharacterized protein (TIGR02453 family)